MQSLIFIVVPRNDNRDSDDLMPEKQCACNVTANSNFDLKFSIKSIKSSYKY